LFAIGAQEPSLIIIVILKDFVLKSVKYLFEDCFSKVDRLGGGK